MTTLILPVAGQSSRFPGMRPKWLLTMPDGKLMIEKSVEKLDLSNFERVVIVCLKEHVDKYLTCDSLSRIVTGLNHSNVEVYELSNPTNSQSETVAQALRIANVSGAFFVKDCDNMFAVKWSGQNEISALDLNDIGLVDAKSKSYITADHLGNVLNIVEKKVISNLFCCGGYGFSSADTFLKHFERIKADNEVYISHVIYSMLLDGVQFRVNMASTYVDWGTLREYRHYMRSFMTLFCDVDGVLLYNGSKFSQNGWATEPIVENLKAIATLQAKGLLYLVITSCRPDSEIEYLSQCLTNNNIRPDRYLMGLPHTRRVLVNDFSLSNPYPSSVSINLERDSKVLSTILDSITIS